MKKHFIAALMSIAVVAPAMVPVEAAAQTRDRDGRDCPPGEHGPFDLCAPDEK